MCVLVAVDRGGTRVQSDRRTVSDVVIPPCLLSFAVLSDPKLLHDRKLQDLVLAMVLAT